MNDRMKIILRYVLISVIILAASGLVVYKMIDTTVVHANDWNALAMRELSRTSVIKPVRGNILDAHGRVLATNLRYYTMRVDYTSEQFRMHDYLEALPALVDSMARYYPQRSRQEWDEHLRRPLSIRNDTTISPARRRARLNSWPLLLKQEYTEVERVKTFPFFNIGRSAKTGLIVEPVIVRSKPYGDLARQSIGLVNEDEKGDKRGKSGLEGALDSLLYGIPGVAKKVPLTRHITNWTDTAAVPGYHVVTTIDIDIQDIVETELLRILDTCNADWGTAVLMDVKTGDIKAISNLEKRNGRYVEGLNHAVRPYEPGSVIKPISMMIALEDGLVRNINEMIPTGGAWAYLGKNPIKDSHAHSAVAVKDVICYSSNIATAKIILRGFENNPSGFVDRLESIGFLDPLGVGIHGEQAPYLNRHPKKIDLSRMAYGYTTMLPPLHTPSS